MEVAQSARNVIDQRMAASGTGRHRRGAYKLVHLRALNQLGHQAQVAAGSVNARPMKGNNPRVAHLPQDAELVRHRDHEPDAAPVHGALWQLHGHVGTVQLGGHDHAVAAVAQHPLGHQLQVHRAEEPTLGLPKLRDLPKVLLQLLLATVLQVLQLHEVLEDIPCGGGVWQAVGLASSRLAGTAVALKVVSNATIHDILPIQVMLLRVRVWVLVSPHADPHRAQRLRRRGVVAQVVRHPDALNLEVNRLIIHGKRCCKSVWSVD
mmetsp:Transcript_92664/g.271265  ORF Transcript_92664/g.271265 Transcript_92664/m.271265 type:complete len:264 (-) Transcript_92664:981-1772(-)